MFTMHSSFETMDMNYLPVVLNAIKLRECFSRGPDSNTSPDVTKELLV
jgi:hypothetical protein